MGEPGFSSAGVVPKRHRTKTRSPLLGRRSRCKQDGPLPFPSTTSPARHSNWATLVVTPLSCKCDAWLEWTEVITIVFCCILLFFPQKPCGSIHHYCCLRACAGVLHSQDNTAHASCPFMQRHFVILNPLSTPIETKTPYRADQAGSPLTTGVLTFSSVIAPKPQAHKRHTVELEERQQNVIPAAPAAAITDCRLFGASPTFECIILRILGLLPFLRRHF